MSSTKVINVLVLLLVAWFIYKIAISVERNASSSGEALGNPNLHSNNLQNNVPFYVIQHELLKQGLQSVVPVPQNLVQSRKLFGNELSNLVSMYPQSIKEEIHSILNLQNQDQIESKRSIVRTPQVDNEQNRAVNSVKKKRKPISQRIRSLVASKQEWKCNHCKQLLPPNFEIDHILPVCAGGTNNLEGLQALCRNCHGVKTSYDGLKFNF